jgi:CheY-like chemotaxis protein
MGAKRALVVDDSKSARAFLSRILERYDIVVDSAENAEQAIEYLVSHLPDVIFMDHMMPGMDGLQAVQTIKANPRTAMIPIMMYTSQEGELYLGQARALGAVGVLPKQIRHADVSKVLYQLHLLPERRSSEQTSFRAISGAVEEVREESVPPAGKVLTDARLREHLAELRRVLVVSLDSQVDRVTGDLRMMLQELLPQLPMRPARARRSWGWAALAAALLAVAAIVLWRQEASERSALAQQLAQLRTPVRVTPPATPAAPTVGLKTPASNEAARTVGASAKPIIAAVPYGADPLGGPRLEVFRQLFDRLVAQHFRGTVEIKTFPGRFCLIGNATDGFSLPPEETAFGRCDLVGASPDEALSQPQRVPLQFADLMSAFRNATRGAADVQILPGDPSVTVASYPAVSESLTAGEWNRAGSANNRIEIRVR